MQRSIVRAVVAGLAAGLLLATPVAASPGPPGPYATITGEYELPPVELPELWEPVEMRAVVVAPREVTRPAPLVVLLHGFYTVCWDGSTGFELWPCPDGFAEVPSYRGFGQIQQHLASQGYVTVSLSANGVNGQIADDGGAQARSSLVRQHLSQWAGWSGEGRSGAPEVIREAPPVDLSRVLLVGHSRGGEGVNRAAMDSLVPPPADVDGAPGPARWRIRGVVLLGATAWGRNPVPDVPSLSILPGCDGDVASLEAQEYVDATRGVGQGVALHSAVFLPGANHNFFNAEWTPGEGLGAGTDDFARPDDPLCSPGAPSRLTAPGQRAAAAAHLTAAARLFLDGADSRWPASPGPAPRESASPGPARGTVPGLSHALGGGRAPLIVPAPGMTVTGPGRLCPLPSCGLTASPHVQPGDPDRYAVAAAWTDPGEPVLIRPERPAVITAATELALRVIVPPNPPNSAKSQGTTFGVAVTDRAGRRSVLGDVRLDGVPGTGNTRSAWAQEARVPLPSGVDREGIASLELIPRSPGGQLWLLDAWGRRPGTPEPGPHIPVRVDVRDGAVPAGATRLSVPLIVSGAGAGEVLLTVRDPRGGATSHHVTVRPGDESAEVPVSVAAGESYRVTAVAVRNTVVGNYQGRVGVD